MQTKMIRGLIFGYLLASAWRVCATDEDVLTAIRSAAKDAEQWIVDVRRQLHAIPELGSHEFKTSAAVKAVLNELGIKYKEGFFKTGIVASLGPENGLPAVAVRADMDALPVQEPEGAVFASRHPGVMHACGHDGHMSMLLGAAKVLKGLETAGKLPGPVRLVFQPDEEGGAGGAHVIEEGALDGVAAAFGVHVAPWISSGTIGMRPDTIMAGALSFHVSITGRGGHAAMPHLNIDPIVAAASVITSLQALVSRETSPLGSAVLSVTKLGGGHAYNVIPDVAEFGGTIRGLRNDVIMSLKSRLETMSAAVAAAYNCNATVDWRLDEQPYYPPTVNDQSTMAFAQRVASQLFGEDRVQIVEPIMAGEDFAFFCRKVPCNFAFLGIKNETLGSVHALHNPKFMLDESVLYRGAALHAALAVEYLNKQAQDAASAKGGNHQEL